MSGLINNDDGHLDTKPVRGVSYPVNQNPVPSSVFRLAIWRQEQSIYNQRLERKYGRIFRNHKHG